MANGNKQGPMNQGPMTGRGAGFCSGSNMPGYATGGGRGAGLGAGAGAGRRCGGGMRRCATYGANNMTNPQFGQNPDAKNQSLKDYAKYLEKEIASVKAQLQE